MQLNNPFSRETKIIYLYRVDCDICGSNQSLELHHITGRDSDSPLNASVLCHNCHETMGHNKEEEKKLFTINLRFLFREHYELIPDDIIYLQNHLYLWENNQQLIKWLRQ